MMNGFGVFELRALVALSIVALVFVFFVLGNIVALRSVVQRSVFFPFFLLFCPCFGALMLYTYLLSIPCSCFALLHYLRNVSYRV